MCHARSEAAILAPVASIIHHINRATASLEPTRTDDQESKLGRRAEAFCERIRQSILDACDRLDLALGETPPPRS
jgi:hypothetical protein